MTGTPLPPAPPPGRGPVPLALALLCAALALWALGYLVFYNGGFRGDIYDETWTPRGAAFADEPGLPPAVLGERVYRANCAVCHQPDGQGLPGQYPPLAGSEVVLGRDGFGENHLARIVLNGLVDPVTVRGLGYNGSMTAWKDVLSDAQAAAVLTYIRQAWGNQAPPVDPAGIAALRAEVGNRFEPWTVAELRKLPPAPLAPAPASPSDTR